MNGITGEELDWRESHVKSLLDFACNGREGRNEDDPVYFQVTEGRDVGASRKDYSSCGDLAHWLFYRLGCRQPWINRDEHLGWRSQDNVMSLSGFSPRVNAPNSVRLTPVPEAKFVMGDVLLIWNDGKNNAHVMVVHDYDPVTRKLVSGEYGQPGGKVNEHVLTTKEKPFAPGGRDYPRLFCGAREIKRWISVGKVIEDAANLGLLEDLDIPDAMIEKDVAPG